MTGKGLTVRNVWWDDKERVWKADFNESTEIIQAESKTGMEDFLDWLEAKSILERRPQGEFENGN